jgi:hypothetical protein
MTGQRGENIHRCDAEVMPCKKQVTLICCTHVLFLLRYVSEGTRPTRVRLCGEVPSLFETARSFAPFLFER